MKPLIGSLIVVTAVQSAIIITSIVIISLVVLTRRYVCPIDKKLIIISHMMLNYYASTGATRKRKTKKAMSMKTWMEKTVKKDLMKILCTNAFLHWRKG